MKSFRNLKKLNGMSVFELSRLLLNRAILPSVFVIVSAIITESALNIVVVE